MTHQKVENNLQHQPQISKYEKFEIIYKNSNIFLLVFLRFLHVP